MNFIDNFIKEFGSEGSEVPGAPSPSPFKSKDQVKEEFGQKPGGLEDFIQEFGNVTEEYSFYNDTVKLRFDKTDHVYFRIEKDGTAVLQDGVTTVCHIIDKSHALMPWACKMMEEHVLAEYEKHKADMPLQPCAHENFESWLRETLVTGKKAHKVKVEEAGDLGHYAHDCLEKAIQYAIDHNDGFVLWGYVGEHCYALKDKLSAENHTKVENCCYAAWKWMALHRVKWVCTERKVYSRLYEYAGTTDGLAYVSSCSNPECCKEKFTDRLSIVDWKSSNYLYIEYRFQTAAYEQAIEEEDNIEIEDRWVLRLGKTDGKFEPWHLPESEFDEDFQVFIDCLNLSRGVRMLEERLRAGKKAKKQAEKEKKALEKLETKAAKKKGLVQ